MSKKPGKGPKSTALPKKAAVASANKLKALQSALEAKKATAAPAGKLKVSPKRVLVFGGGAVVMVGIVLLIFFSVPHKEAPPEAPLQAKTLAPESVPGQPRAAPPALSGDDRKDFPAIRNIRFEPSQPTRMDTLKAEILADSPEPGRTTYVYVWKVNDRIVENVQGGTLDLSALAINKRDLITVSVTPYDGEREGFTVESPVVAVHSIPPTLDMKMPGQTRKASEPLEVQLVSVHPDSERVVFSLEAPIVPGMSIDAVSGKITWVIQPNQEGTIRFGAAVEDADQTRRTRIFDITLEKSFVAPAPAGAGQNSPSRPEGIVERR
ncbi:MAG: hypothetical protein C0394_04935 [Syntrophus sp. (in: bacteria)]|nr:hypothetical protein [Syntrophus sp. (in: bacteria)]